MAYPVGTVCTHRYQQPVYFLWSSRIGLASNSVRGKSDGRAHRHNTERTEVAGRTQGALTRCCWLLRKPLTVACSGSSTRQREAFVYYATEALKRSQGTYLDRKKWLETKKGRRQKGLGACDAVVDGRPWVWAWTGGVRCGVVVGGDVVRSAQQSASWLVGVLVE